MAADAREPEGGDGPAGYGRPPRSGRFRQGASGNPSGKRKGTQNRPRPPGEQLRALMRTELYRPVKWKVEGVEVTMPLAQAVLRSLGEGAMKGDARAQAQFFKMMSAEESEETAVREMEKLIEEAREPEKPVIAMHIVDVVDGRPVRSGEVIYPYGGGPDDKRK